MSTNKNIASNSTIIIIISRALESRWMLGSLLKELFALYFIAEASRTYPGLFTWFSVGGYVLTSLYTTLSYISLIAAGVIDTETEAIVVS